MPRHFSRKRDMDKFNGRKMPSHKRTLQTKKLFAELEAQQILRVVEKKPRNRAYRENVIFVSQKKKRNFMKGR